MEIVVLNYEDASVHHITLNDERCEPYKEDYDALVYGKLGYKESECYYMIGESIEELHYDDEDLQELF